LGSQLIEYLTVLDVEQGVTHEISLAPRQMHVGLQEHDDRWWLLAACILQLFCQSLEGWFWGGEPKHTCCYKLRPQSAPVYYMQIWLAMRFSHLEDRSNPRAGVPKQQIWVISYTGQLWWTARLEYNVFYGIWVALMTTPVFGKFTDTIMLSDMFSSKMHMMLLMTMICIFKNREI